jgi:hypothetical protein
MFDKFKIKKLTQQIIFNIFIIMDVNKFISQHLFDGLIELKISQLEYEYLGTSAKVVFIVDHSKLSRNSKSFDEKYYRMFMDIDNGIYTNALEEIIPMVGFSDTSDLGISSKFLHKNIEVYNEILDKISNLGYDNEINTPMYSPFPIIYIDCDDNIDIQFVVETLEKYGFDVDDIVFSDDY